MANGNMGRRTSSSASSQKNNTRPVKTRKEVMDKIASLEKEMARTKERMDNATNFVSRRTAESAYNRLMNSYDKAMIEYDNLPQEPRSQRAPQLTGSRR
jgi:TATA-binding protein-associated factor Taf7